MNATHLWIINDIRDHIYNNVIFSNVLQHGDSFHCEFQSLHETQINTTDQYIVLLCWMQLIRIWTANIKEHDECLGIYKTCWRLNRGIIELAEIVYILKLICQLSNTRCLLQTQCISRLFVARFILISTMVRISYVLSSADTTSQLN